MNAPLPTLDATLSVETPEQVALTYTVAGFGSRALAALVDALIIAALSFVLFILFGVLAIGTLITHAMHSAGPGVALALLILAWFVLLWGYYVFFEGVNDGQTPGKRVFGLRVVRDGGFSMTFSASAIRNLARVVDAQPGFTYCVGAISVLATRSGKRLGDFLAGTFVVHESRVSYDAGPRQPWHREDHTATASSTIPVPVTPVLADDEYDVLDRYMTRRLALTPERRRALAQQLAGRLQRHLDDGASSPSAALVALFEREQAARGSDVAMRSDTGGRREQHAIVALGVVRWNEFAALLATVRRTRLRRMSARQVSDFVARYREIGADLARLQTASRGRTFDALFFVSRLVAGGHAVLYRGRRGTLATAVRYFTEDVPREIRRSAGAIALAAACLFLPAAIAYGVVVADPSVAPTFVSPVILQRAAEGAARMRRHQGYVTISPDARPVAASFIITHNVQISYIAFALGLTAGIGTLLVLLINGVSLGGAVGVYSAKGLTPLLLAFLAPHGVLELSAACLGGGSGLLIASAFVLPGAVTRTEALVARGRRAIRLVVAATLFLIVAGTIEGLVSPRVWPLPSKLAVSAATAVAMALYIALGWRRSVRRVPA